MRMRMCVRVGGSYTNDSLPAPFTEHKLENVFQTESNSNRIQHPAQYLCIRKINFNFTSGSQSILREIVKKIPLLFLSSNLVRWNQLICFIIFSIRLVNTRMFRLWINTVRRHYVAPHLIYSRVAGACSSLSNIYSFRYNSVFLFVFVTIMLAFARARHHILYSMIKRCDYKLI